MTYNTVLVSNCIRENVFFKILLRNMFNRAGTKYHMDEQGNPEYIPGESYVAIAKWNDFVTIRSIILNRQ